MERPLNTTLDTVQRCFADTMLGPPVTPTRIGAITLHAHQMTALHRIQTALSRFGGALLCDDVGLGKTYVALAAANGFNAPLIIAPATLKPMWHSAMHDTHVRAQWRSIQSLSHPTTPFSPYDFIIVDEAHHARTPSTKRYQTLASLCASAPVLLLSATPIHNSSTDLHALIALFLGSHAKSLSPQQLTQLIVRRTTNHIPSLPTIPKVHSTHWIPTPHNPTLGNAILQLPPPVPLHHDHTAPSLITVALLRQWISSESTLRHALTRRIARATTLLNALDTGYIPTQHDIDSWTIGDDAMQLTFPQLMPTAPPNAHQLASAIRTHTRALQELHDQIPHTPPSDLERATIIRAIRARHPNQRIIAFSQYAQTIRHLFRALRHDPNVAALTAGNAYIASGPVSRQHILAKFTQAASPSTTKHHTDITLLLTTDLLSEGVNLQSASVIIHLDFPWTPATLHQRIGRVARIGSNHTEITVYGFRIPSIPDQYIRMMATLHAKTRVMHELLGKPTELDTAPHLLETSELIHRTLSTWQAQNTEHPPHANPTRTTCATISVSRTSNVTQPWILAACIDTNRPHLLTGPLGGSLTDDPITVARVIQRCDGPQRAHQPAQYAQALYEIRQWWSSQTARHDAGIAPHIQRHDQPATHTPRLVQHLAALVQRLPPIHRARFAEPTATIVRATEHQLPIHSERDWHHRARQIIEQGDQHTRDRHQHASHSPEITPRLPSDLHPHHTLQRPRSNLRHDAPSLHVAALLILDPAPTPSSPTPSSARTPTAPNHHPTTIHPPRTHPPRRRRLPLGLCPNVPSPSCSTWTVP